MEFQKMTNVQKMLNNSQFIAIVEMYRHLSPEVADLLMQNRLPLDMHVKALEEVERRQPVFMD